MINQHELYERHADLCRTLASPKRLEILDSLRDGERSVSEISELTGMTLANASQHLTLMRRKGVVSARREGATVYYRIANPKMLEACAIIREVLLEQFRADAHLAEFIESRG